MKLIRRKYISISEVISLSYISMSDIDSLLLQKYIWPTSFQIWMMGPKMWSAPNKMEVLFNFCFYNFFAKSHGWGYRANTTPLLAPLTPRLGSSLSLGNLTKLTIWKVHYNVCFIMKMINHSSRSTWGPCPSRSRFWVQRCVMPLLNHGSITFVL